MLQTEYTENLFRSIDTIIAERIKNLPYDTTQLAEITDITNCKQGMYKISADNQFEEIAYSDNPTYEVGDKVYVLTTSDKTRRFIIGIFQRCSSGRTDRILSTLNQKIELLDSSLTDKYLELKDETGQFMAQLSITAKELRSEYFDLSQGLSTLISQTAEEILLKAENSIEQKYASLSITADGISTRVGDAINELETRINQTASEIRLEAEDMKNGLEASLSITAKQIRSEVSNELLGVESSISQTASEIRSEVADHLLGIESSISQTANEIRSEIHDETGAQESSIDQKLDEIRLRVTDTQLGMSEISQQADSINSRVEDIEGNFSQIKQEADKITTKVYDIEGNYSEIQQTANAIRSRVEDVNNGLSSEIEQTASSIRSEVEDINNGLNSKIEQTAGSITTLTEDLHGNYSTTEQTSTEITNKVQAVDGKYSLTKSTVDGWSVTTDNGTTEINGAKIKTGTITANRINATEFNIAVSSTNWGTSVGSLGYGEGNDGKSTTKGVMLAGPGGTNYLIATNAGVRMQSGDNQLYCTDGIIKGEAPEIIFQGSTKTTINGGNKLCDCVVNEQGIYLQAWKNSEHTKVNGDAYHAFIAVRSPSDAYALPANDKKGTINLSANTVQSSTTISTPSDRNKKNSISYEIDKYNNFYELIKPAFYKMNDGTSDRYHIGYIYQDVESALLKSGLTSKDFAGLVKMHENNGELFCGLRYSEFIALNTYMIQKTRKELEEKENKIQQLENKIDELEQKLNLLLETLS